MAKGKRGPGNCNVCRHARRVEIDLALVAQVPMSTIAERYEVSADSVWRHSENHLSASQRAGLLVNLAPTAVDIERLSKSESESLLSNLITQRSRLSTYANECATARDWRSATAVERVVLENLATVAKLLGAIVSRSEISHTHLTLTPSYLKLRQALVAVLRPYPQIAAEVAAALAAIEQDEATDITTRAAKPLTIEHQPENAHV